MNASKLTIGQVVKFNWKDQKAIHGSVDNVTEDYTVIQSGNSWYTFDKNGQSHLVYFGKRAPGEKRPKVLIGEIIG